MHVEQHNVGLTLTDKLDGRIRVVSFPYDLEVLTESSLHSLPEQIVIIDNEHPKKLTHGEPSPACGG